MSVSQGLSTMAFHGHKCYILSKSNANSFFLNNCLLVILNGFGNLRTRCELCDTTSRKLIANSDSPDTTLLEWSPMVSTI